MKRINFFIPAVLLLANLLLLTEARAQSVMPYAGEFLQLGVGARSLALGGASIAIANDVTAGYWNPAGLTALQYPGVTGMHETRFDGTVQYNYGAFAMPLGATQSLGISVLQISVSDIKDTRNALIDKNGNGILDGEDAIDYSKVTSFGNHDWAVYLSYAKEYDSRFSYGASAKMIFRKLEDSNSAVGLGVDIGAQYKATDQLMLAAVAQDLTTTLLAYDHGYKELIAPTLKLGGAYTLNITSNGTHRFTPTIDMDVRFEDRGTISEVHAGPLSADFHFGGEYQFKDLFAIRAGYSDLKLFSIGAGIKLPKLSVDYSFLSFSHQDQLGNTHRISFAFTFDQPKWKRPDAVN